MSIGNMTEKENVKSVVEEVLNRNVHESAKETPKTQDGEETSEAARKDERSTDRVSDKSLCSHGIEICHRCTQHSKDNRTKPQTYNDLPLCVKSVIVGHVQRPTDLKALCRVSKEMHDLAVRVLYNDIAFDVGCPKDQKIISMLSPGNKGLKHIRKILVDLANVQDRCNQEQQAHLTIRMLLEFLPEDILDEFSWSPWKPFSVDNMKLLYQKQKRMKWLEIIGLDKLTPAPELFPAASIKTVRKLAIYVENQETLDMAAYAVKQTMDRIEDLVIHAEFNAEPVPADLHDSATAPGLISRSVFASVMPFEKATPFRNLDAVQLRKIDLYWCQDTYCKVIDFSKMRSLQLYHCPGAFALLGQLCKSKNLPLNLKTFEFQHKDNSENKTLDALDGFLCLIAGVKNLTLDLESVKALPAAAGIVRHANTLRILNVHASKADDESEGDTDEHVWSTDDFEKIATACKHLEQMSCAWPTTYIIKPPGDDWKIYENNVARLRDLVTLNITTWPTNRPGTNQLVRSVYESLLRSYAQRLFENIITPKSPSDSSATTLPSPPAPAANSTAAATISEELMPAKLRLVAFGTSDKIYEREDSKNQAIFLRSSTINAMGMSEAAAVPIGWTLRQHVERRSSVLDFVLHLADDSRMPCSRESDHSRGFVDLDD